MGGGGADKSLKGPSLRGVDVGGRPAKWGGGWGERGLGQLSVVNRKARSEFIKYKLFHPVIATLGRKYRR